MNAQILTAAAKVMSKLQIDLVDDRSGILQKLYYIHP